MRAVLIEPPFGSPQVIEIPRAGGAQLSALQELVGGWIEAVALTVVTDRPAVGIVNEEGLLLGLAANVGASVLCGQRIVGPMVIVGIGHPPEFADCGTHWCMWAEDVS